MTRDELLAKIQFPTYYAGTSSTVGPFVLPIDYRDAKEWEAMLDDAALGRMLREMPEGWQLFRAAEDAWGIFDNDNDPLTGVCATPDAALSAALASVKAEEKKDDAS